MKSGLWQGGLLVLASVLLVACGGSSSGGSKANQTVSGAVVDPAIAGATVELRDAEGTALAPVVVTGEDGTFSFSVPKDTDLSGALFISRGGVDQETGYSFANAILRGFADADAQVVSPLTELVAGLVEGGSDRETAVTTVAGWFGLNDDEVLVDPRTDADTQVAALKVSVLIHGLRHERDPLNLIRTTLQDVSGDISEAIESLQANTSTENTLQSLNIIRDLLNDFEVTDFDSSTAVVDAFNKANLRTGLKHYFFGNDDVDETQKSSLDALANAILAINDVTNGGAPDSAKITNIARFIAGAHDISEETLSDADFLPPVIDPSVLANILRDAIDHLLPLTTSELLGDDSEKRLAYFYSSDLSPFYRAEQYVAGIYDDTVLDPVYQSIAEGQARAGLLDDALVTLNTRIFQTTSLLEGQRLIGKALGEIGRQEDAEAVLRQGLASAEAIIEAKGGAANITKDEATLLIGLANAASAVGLTDVAQNMLEPLREYANANNAEYTTSYGTLMSALATVSTLDGGRPIADAVVAYEAGESSQQDAAMLVGLYQELIENMPPQTNGSKALIAMHLMVLADFQDRIGEDPWDTVDAWYDIVMDESQETSHRKTSGGYLRYAANVWGRNNQVSEFLALVEAIKSAVDMTSGNYNGALAAIAPWQAIAAVQSDPENGLQDGIDLVIDGLEDSTDLSAQMDALLWLGVNQSNRGMALRLAEQGYGALALEVVQYAKDLVESEAWQTAYADEPYELVTQGCGKIAWALFRLGDETGGLQQADACQSFIAGYAWSDNEKKISAYSSLTSNSLSLMGEAAASRVADVVQAIHDLAPNDYSWLTSVASSAAWAGDDQLALTALTAARTALDGEVTLPVPDADSDEDRLPKLNTVLTYIYTPLNVISNLRARIALDGVPGEARLAVIALAQEQIRGLLLDEENPLVDAVDKILAPTDRKDTLNELISNLASAGFHDEAFAVAAKHSTFADYTEAVGNVADALVNGSAFPGSLFASQDLDGDGKPDFFNPVPESAGTNPFTLDDDTDGDGCPDSADRRPFFASDVTGECAA